MTFRLWLLTIVVLGMAPPAYGATCGDLNGDGSIGTGDVVLLQRVVLENPDPVVCSGQPAPSCGDVDSDGSISTADVVILYGYVLGNPFVLCPGPKFCDNSIAPSDPDSSWKVEFAAPALWSQINDAPPTHPAQCSSNNTAGNLRTDIPRPGATRPSAIVLQWEDPAPTLSQRDSDISFKIVSGDLPGFNHLFLGVGEEALGNGNPEQNAGRVGAAIYGGRMCTSRWTSNRHPAIQQRRSRALNSLAPSTAMATFALLPAFLCPDPP
jgi:hypothetical protein